MMKLHFNNGRDDLIGFTKFVAYLIETATKRCRTHLTELSSEGSIESDNLCVIADLQGLSTSNIDYQGMKSTFWLLNVHYPERLGICLLLNCPLIFKACWYLIKSWLPPRTRDKVKFVNGHDDLREYVNDRTIECFSNSLI